MVYLPTNLPSKSTKRSKPYMDPMGIVTAVIG